MKKLFELNEKETIKLKSILVTLLIWSFFQIPVSTYAQEESHFQIELSAKGNYMYDGNNNWGYGGSAKFLLPLRKNNNYITTAVNFDRFKVSGMKNYYYNLLSVTGGYRKMINYFFIEPQLGFGYILDENISIGFGVEPGFQINKFTFSLNFQLITDGIFWADYLSVIGLRAGIRF